MSKPSILGFKASATKSCEMTWPAVRYSRKQVHTSGKCSHHSLSCTIAILASGFCLDMSLNTTSSSSLTRRKSMTLIKSEGCNLSEYNEFTHMAREYTSTHRSCCTSKLFQHDFSEPPMFRITTGHISYLGCPILFQAYLCIVWLAYCLPRLVSRALRPSSV